MNNLSEKVVYYPWKVGEESVVSRILDSLSSYEQMVMKCCAYLGNQFSREILLYAVRPSSPREFALAIQKLFDLKILACAKGDFSDGIMIVTPEKILLRRNYDEMTCECRNNKIHETCLDLPKYAACSYMQFCSTCVPDIVYQLAVDEQKKEFHLRAMEYIETQIGKCAACDFEPLHQLLDATAAEQQDSMENLHKHPTRLSSTTKQFNLLTVPVTPTEISVDNREDDLSTEDSQNCQCLPILSTAFSQITVYYKNVGSHFMESSRIIEVMLQFASSLIKSSNPLSALTVLEKSLNVLKATPRADLPSWQNKLVGGKIYTMMGYAHMKLNQSDDAEYYLRSALKRYRSEFLPHKLSSKFKTSKIFSKPSFGLFVLPETKKSLSYWQSYITNNVSEVLSHLATLFMNKNQWAYAELAATWSLWKALKANNDFKILCTAYSNMLLIALYYEHSKLSRAAVEVYALRLCYVKTESMTYLYDVEKAKQIGDISLRTATSIQTTELILPISPMLMYACLLNKDVDVALETLENLRLFAEQNHDRSANLWYMAQCVSFHLETGYVIVPYDVCEKLGEVVVYSNFVTIRDKAARNHFCVTMWLWCIRNRNWEKTVFWYSKIEEFYRFEDYNGVINKLTGLYLLEGWITNLVAEIDGNDKKSYRRLWREIEKLMKNLEKSAETMEIILPRLYHLKAYYRAVRYQDAKAFKYLVKAKKFALKYSNALEQEWVMHSLKAWNKTMEEAAMNFWQEHCNEQNHLYYHEMEPNGEFLYFTLPLPKHVGNKMKKISQIPHDFETDEGDVDCWENNSELINQHGTFDRPITLNDGSQIEPWLEVKAERTDNDTAYVEELSETRKYVDKVLADFGDTNISDSSRQRKIKPKKEFNLVATYNKSPDEEMQTFSEQDDGYCIFLPKLKIRPGLSAVFRTLDSLLSQEQLVTKLCCAILGEQFSRDMLLYVVNPRSQREFALTIKKLFELKILACAKRDFSAGTVIVTSEDTVSPQSYEDIACECRDNKIQETCLDLPKYASCSYMKFCNTYIPDITYQSSPDQQKREFHLRAVEYLEEQRGHCHICDDGPLGQIFNPTAEHEDIMESLMSQSTPLPSTSEINFDNRGRISKLKDYQSLLRDFSIQDFQDCQCVQILSTAYSQITTYYRSANCHFMKSLKVIDVMLQYANVLIRSSDLQLATTVLENALDVFQTTQPEDLPWQNKLVGGKIASLMGYVCMKSNKFDKAECYLRSALMQYGCEFSSNKFSSKFKISRIRAKPSVGLFVLPNLSKKKRSTYLESYICNNTSETLSHLTTLFMKQHQWKYAEFAATWSLLEALKANSDFKILCTAYSNVLLIALHRKNFKLSAAIEVYGLQLCNTKTEIMKWKEIKAVIKLYTSIFWSVLPNADVEKTKQIGRIALRMAVSIQALEMVLPILQMLMSSCLLTKDVDGAVEILDELYRFIDTKESNSVDDSQSRLLWYAAHCVAFHLETGHVYTSHDICEGCGEDLTHEDFVVIENKEIINNYCIIMWLWFVRNHNLKKAALWYSKIKEFFQLKNDDCVVNHLNGLYLLEGLIITLVYKTDENDQQTCHNIKKEIKKLIETLEESAKNMKIILPRLFHLKAYYRAVRYQDAKAFKYLVKAKKFAVEYKNTLEQEWVMHSLKAWNKTMEEAGLNFWQEHCNEQNYLYYHNMEPNGEFVYFTLPLPKHVGNKMKKIFQIPHDVETDEGETDCKDTSCDNIDLNNTDVSDITYELSADEQKREVHLHAIENLEKQRRHCRICDYRFLHKILDPTAELDSMESLNNQPTPSTSEQSDLSTVTVPVTPTGINVDNCEDTDEFKSIFGFRCILKLRNFNLLTGNLSTEDSQDCQCLPILSTAYSEITAYYEDVGRDFMKLSKIIDIMLHYASVLIKSSNPSLALTVLENALNVLKTTPRTDLSSWQTGLVRGKIHGLMGHAYMELHVFEDLSESHLKLALKYYNHEFSFVKLSNKSKALQSRLKQYFGLLVLPNAIEKKNSSRLEAYICNNVSEVLSHLAVLFMKKNLWPYAELAATESLSEALKTYNNFELLCSTYSNMLLIALHYKYKKLSAAIEINALCLSGTKTGSMTRNELKTVTKLYASIFWYALPHADIEKTKQIGDNALRTAISVQAPKLIWPILPMLMFVCLLKKDVNTAVYILDNLRLFNEHNQYNEKKSGTLWYLSQCISFHLETGYTVVPYDECEKLGRAMVYMCIKDKAALNHYCVTMWLWCVRNCNWEKTTFWYSKIKRFYQLKDNDCVANKLTGLYLLEGLITSLVYKIDDAAVPTCNNIEREIKHLIKTMEKSAKTMEIILTRLFHMKAYYRAVRYNSVNLLKAYKLAVKYNNVLEQEWVMHSLKTWNKTLDEAALNFWQEHCNEQNYLYYHEMEPNGEFLYFTLPIPSRRRK